MPPDENPMAARPDLCWSARYETGVEALDVQHRRLFEIVEAVGARARQPDGRHPETFETDFDRLADYAQFHFDFEEELLATTGMSLEERRAHTVTHRAFIDEMQALWTRRHTFEHAGEALYRFLAAWVVDHVLGDDLRVAKDLRRAAETPPATVDAA
jgi:hemerythrin-like metal-binding protein